jgi:hypothetical protein
MCTHLNRFNVHILSASSLTSDIWIRSITPREHKTNTCNYLGNCTRSRWRDSLLHFTKSSTRWQHQPKSSIWYSLSEKCLISNTHWLPLPRPSLCSLGPVCAYAVYAHVWPSWERWAAKKKIMYGIVQDKGKSTFMFQEWTIGFDKWREISLLAERLLASKGGLFSMELINVWCIKCLSYFVAHSNAWLWIWSMCLWNPRL